MLYAAYNSYSIIGFTKLSKKYNDLLFISTNDTLDWLIRKAIIEDQNPTADTSLNVMAKEIYRKDPSFLGLLKNGLLQHLVKGEYAKALDSLQKLEPKILISTDSVTPFFVFGYTYLKNGMKEKANYHFNGGIKMHEDEIKLNSMFAKSYYSHFALAAIYSILDERQKSLNYLRMMTEAKCLPRYYLIALNERFMFENVRQEPEFKTVVKELEDIYNKEHERIKKLLISKGWEDMEKVQI